MDILWVTFAYPRGPCGAIEYIYVPTQAQNRVILDPKTIKSSIPVKHLCETLKELILKGILMYKYVNKSTLRGLTKGHRRGHNRNTLTSVEKYVIIILYLSNLNPPMSDR